MVFCLLNTSLARPLFETKFVSSCNVGTTSQPLREKCFPVVPCRRKSLLLEPHEKGQKSSSAPNLLRTMLQASVLPLLASLSIVFWSNPAHAGFLSGFPGIESVPGPQLPQIDFLTQFNDENQKRYAENDARIKESPIIKQLLEQSKLNKEKNRQAIQDKYCIRGAEWGVGDCSAEAMSPEDKEKFIAMLKQKAGVE